MHQHRPVALVGDETVLDDLLRLAAAAGCELQRIADPGELRTCWAAAPLVLLDPEATAVAARSRLSRRRGIVVVAGRKPDTDLLRQAVAIGAEQVVTLPADEGWVIGAFADTVDGPAREAGRVLAVLGARGGAGASVLAAAVAHRALRQQRSALLIDGDPLGGGLDVLLGAEAEDGLRWPELQLTEGRVAAASLHAALPGHAHGDARLTVLSCGRDGPGPDAAAVEAVIESGSRSGELVVCDVPRDIPEAARAAVERADLAVLLVPAEVRACAAARRVAARIRECGTEPVAVVRGPAPGGLPAAQVAQAAGVPLLTAMRAEPNLPAAVESGEFQPRPRGPLAKAADAVLAELIEPRLRLAAS